MHELNETHAMELCNLVCELDLRRFKGGTHNLKDMQGIKEMTAPKLKKNPPSKL